MGHFPKSQPLIPFSEYSQYFLSFFPLSNHVSENFLELKEFRENDPPAIVFSDFLKENPIRLSLSLSLIQLSLKFFQSIRKHSKEEKDRR